MIPSQRQTWIALAVALWLNAAALQADNPPRSQGATAKHAGSFSPTDATQRAATATIVLEGLIFLGVCWLLRVVWRLRSSISPRQLDDQFRREIAAALLALQDKLQRDALTQTTTSGESVPSSVSEQQVRDVAQSVYDHCVRPLQEDVEQMKAKFATGAVSAELEQQRASLLREQQALDAEKERVEADRRAAEEALTQARRERESAERIRKDAEALGREVEQHRAALLRSQEDAWPASFQAALADWRRRIECRIRDAMSAAPLLYSALFKYAALSRRDDGKDMPQTLQDVSRFAYQYWEELGLDAAAREQAATEWARAFEAELGGKWFLRIAHVGEPKDQTWMNYRPDTNPVAAVQTWCVQNDKRVTVVKAHVA